MENDFLTINKRELWNNILGQKSPYDSIVLQFLTRNLDLDYLSSNYAKCEIDKIITTLIDALLCTTIPRIRLLLSSSTLLNAVSASNIPQFSNFATAVIYLPELLLLSHSQLTYRDLGYSLFSETKSSGAAEKYGQNHGNLAMQLGLASITKIGNKNVYCPTPLTPQYCQLDQTTKMELLQRLCFRIPIIQLAATSDTPTAVIDECLQNTLAKSTYMRRKSNVLEVLAFALGE